METLCRRAYGHTTNTIVITNTDSMFLEKHIAGCTRSTLAMKWFCSNDWTNLTQRECRILRGFTAQDDDEGIWGLLGWVRAGGAYVFNPANMPEVESIRMQIQEQIIRALQAGSTEIAAVGTDAMMTIRQLQHVENADRGIGHAAATRWLALARPDCIVSVNNASATGLGEASGLPQNSDRLANVYADLLAWLHDQTVVQQIQWTAAR